MSHLRASEEPSGRTAEGQLIGCLSGDSSCKEASVLTSQGQPHMNVWMLSNCSCFKSTLQCGEEKVL